MGKLAANNLGVFCFLVFFFFFWRRPQSGTEKIWWIVHVFKGESFEWTPMAIDMASS